MNKNQRPVLLLFLLLLAGSTSQAQQVWSLEKCVDHALDNNITMKQAEASVRTAMLSERQAKAARLPSLNGTVNAGQQYGRTIDPTSNQFITTGFGFNSLSLGAGANLFTGGQVYHSVKQARWENKAAQADAEDTGNMLGLQVAQAYLTVLLSEEQLESAQRRVQLSTTQLNNTLKLIQAGNLPMADRYTLDAQIARDEQALIVAQNNLDLAYLSLKNLLQLEPDFDMVIERPLVTIPNNVRPEGYSLNTVYNTALSTQPNIRAVEYRTYSAREGIAIAKSAYFPTLSVFANLSSNYSSQFVRPVATGNLTPQTLLVDINGTPGTVTLYNPEVQYEDVNYFDQIDQNFGQGLGVSLSIPIYQNGRTRLNVERARLNLLSTQMQETQARQQLKNDVQTAIANVRAGQKQLLAAQRSFEATQTAFSNTEKLHSLGAATVLELSTAKTNLDIAERDLIIAKYDYLFRLKILDFYEGKPLNLR